MITAAGIPLLLNRIGDGTGATADEWAFDLLLFASVVSAWCGSTRLRGRGFPKVPRFVAWGLLGLAPVMLVGAIVLPPKLRPEIAKIRPRSVARLQISAPTPGQRVSGQLMTVRLVVIGGTITSTTSTNLTSNTGHIHLSVDGSLVSMAYGSVQQVVIADLTPGPHVLKAEFVAADHGPFNPPVTTSVTFVKQE